MNPPPSDGDPGNPSVDFHGERRSNATHQSTTDPEARLYRKGKGKEAKLVFIGHALMENRNGLLTDFQVTEASGTAERDAVPVLLDEAKERGLHPKTLGGDKGYDTQGCVEAMRSRNVTPHVAQNTSGRRSAIDGRTTRHAGYRLSQRIRKRVEEIFGWMKTVGGFRRTRFRGVDRTGLAGYLVATAYNLVRLVMLRAAEAQRVSVHRVSFIDALRWLCHVGEGEPLCGLIVRPHRPGRHEPRVRKRRPKQYPLMKQPRPTLRKALLQR